jgi:CRISPR-associated protein Cas5t
MDAISMLVSVPVCSFRKPYAREFFETERFPPPATVYGFLLSLVGEEDRETYLGTKLALAVVEEPHVSTILRTTWRIKIKKTPPGKGNNRKPDYQEILTGLHLYICVSDCPLVAELKKVAESPQEIERFGGLSLGESRDLVNEIVFDPHLNGQIGQWLHSDNRGQYPLPIWVDHVGSKGTVWGKFSMVQAPLFGEIHTDDTRWVLIRKE